MSMGKGEITVLRLGHRPQRDKRITTHVALVARAFGANSIQISEKDAELEKTIRDVVDRFGGDFSIETGVSWKKVIRQWEGPVIHLTMYGERLEDMLGNIEKGDVLVVVGAEKVPGEVFKLADYNVSVGNQPHSEVAALALFLDRFTEAKWAGQRFEGKRIILPSRKGKTVIDIDEGYLDREDCLKVLREAGCEQDVIKHSEVVTKLAVKMAEACEADQDLVRTASMLHDIGRSVTHGPEHGYQGGRILRKMGFPESIASIVERHVGGGLGAQELKGLGLPAKDLVPVTLEEKIVCLADKLVDDNQKVRLEIEIQKLMEKGLEKATQRVKELHRELTKICCIDPEELDL